MSLRFSLHSVPKFFRQQSKLQTTIATPPKSHIPSIYHNRSESAAIAKSLLNLQDSRTYPRYLVALTAACMFSVSSANSFWYNHHHLNQAVKNDLQAGTHTERPVQMVRTLSHGPIIMNAKRYETLRHKGLGVEMNDSSKK